MKILRVAGIGLAIVILKLLMTATFSGFEGALQALFLFLQTVFQHGQAALQQSGSFSNGSYPGWIP